MNIELKEFMSEKGVSSAFLAEKVGISKVAVSNIVTGKSLPSLDTLVKIAEVLNVTISDLIGESKISGFVKFRGRVYEVGSFDDLRDILALEENK